MDISGSPPPRHTNNSIRYSIPVYLGSVAIVLIVFAVKLLLDSFIEEESPFLLFLGGVMIAAWFGRPRAGLLATLLAALLIDIFFLSPGETFLVQQTGQTLQLLLFILEGVLISGVVERLRRTRKQEQSLMQNQIETEIGERKRVEQALRESEAKLRLALQNSPVSVYTADRDLRYTWIHNARFGFTINEMLGKRDDELLPLEQVRELVQLKQDVLATGTGARRRITTTIHDSLFSFIVAAEPLRDTNGDIQGLTVITVDVSDYERVQVALLESEARFRVLIEAMAQAVWETNAEGVVVTDSPSWREYTGQSREEMMGYGWMNAVHPDDRDHAQTQWREAVANSTNFSIEYRLRRSNGGWRWTNVRAAPLFNEDGSIAKWVGMNIDITERKQAEESLRASERQQRELAESIEAERSRLAAVLDNLPVGVWIADLDGALVGKNEAADRIWAGDAPLTQSKEQYTTYTAHDAQSGKMLSPEDYPVAKALATGEPVEPVELNIRRFDGTPGTVLVSAAPIKNKQGMMIGVVGINVDITQRKRTEKALQQERDVFEQIVTALPVMITVYEPSTEVLYLNPECERLVGWTTEEIRDIDLMEHLYPDPEYRTMVREYMQSLAPGWRDLFLQTRDGSILESAWANIELSDGRHVGIGLDMRERKRAERRAHLLQTLAATLSKAVTQQEVIEITIQQGILALGASAGLIATVPNGDVFLQVIGSVGYPKQVIDMWQSITVDRPITPLAAAVQNRAPLWLKSREDCVAIVAPISELAPERQHRACAILPSNINAHLTGVLELGFDTPREFDPAEQAFLLTLTDYCAQAMERARLTEQARKLAAVEERQRLARDLHDAVSQVLFASTTIAESVPLLWDRNPEKGQALLKEVHTLNRAAMAEMRKLLFELRPEAIEQTSFEVLLDHLTRAMQAQKRIDIELKIDMKHASHLPPDAHVALYRIAQEALNNVLKHSNASKVRVTCAYNASNFRLDIKDNGRGFDFQRVTMGMGMHTMNERATAIGASLKITSAKNQGTQITVTWQPG